MASSRDERRFPERPLPTSRFPLAGYMNTADLLSHLQETLGHLLERRPEEVIRRAVKGMLPRTKLGVQQLRKLKVYAGPDHPHQAQRPEPLA